MSGPDFFSSLDDVAETQDDFVKAWNKFVELISEYGARDKGEEIVLRGGPIPDLGKAMIKEVLDQWPSAPSFEILLDDSLMAEATVCSFFGGAPTLPPSIAWPHPPGKRESVSAVHRSLGPGPGILFRCLG